MGLAVAIGSNPVENVLTPDIFLVSHVRQLLSQLLSQPHVINISFTVSFRK